VIPPIGQTVRSGTSATFEVVAAGTAPLQYAWTKAGSSTSLSSSSILTLGSVSATSAGTYTVTVTNPMGSQVSASVPLGVVDSLPLVFVLQPVSTIGISTGTITLTSSAQSGYKMVGWRRTVTGPDGNLKTEEMWEPTGRLVMNGNAISGVYQALASDSDAVVETSSGTWTQTLSLTNKYLSAPATVSVNLADPLYAAGFRTEPPSTAWTNLAQQQIVIAGEGSSASFRMFPVGDGLTFSWRKTITAGTSVTTADVPSADKATLTLRGLQASQGTTSAGTVTYTGVVKVPNG
jgi:hypothetical protein